jgi:Flp pilus assembly CpaE family ATPase
MSKLDKAEVIIVILELTLAVMKNSKKLANLFKKIKPNDTS